MPTRAALTTIRFLHKHVYRSFAIGRRGHVRVLLEIMPTVKESALRELMSGLHTIAMQSLEMLRREKNITGKLSFQVHSHPLDRQVPYACLFTDETWNLVISSSLVLMQTMVYKKFHQLNPRDLGRALEQFSKDKFSPLCRVHQVGSVLALS